MRLGCVCLDSCGFFWAGSVHEGTHVILRFHRLDAGLAEPGLSPGWSRTLSPYVTLSHLLLRGVAGFVTVVGRRRHRGVQYFFLGHGFFADQCFSFQNLTVVK